jgi:AhpD family alkylhydroperoxidase
VRTFQRRLFRSPGACIGEILFLLSRPGTMRRVMRGGLSPAFRERLMLAVTAVNGCRYCAWFHSRVALRAGVDGAEVAAILAGMTGKAPESEIPALLYAVHWAERDAVPDPDSRDELRAIYGGERAEAIEFALRLIRVGNLLGNSWDYLLHRLSGGKPRRG